MEAVSQSDRMLYLFLAYTAIWILLGSFIFYLARKTRSIEKEIDRLNTLLNRKE